MNKGRSPCSAALIPFPPNSPRTVIPHVSVDHGTSALYLCPFMMSLYKEAKEETVDKIRLHKGMMSSAGVYLKSE